MRLRCCLVASWLVSAGTLFADTRVGSSINNFRSSWGSPSSEETLVRTATLKWSLRPNGKSIAPGVFAVEVAFLDGIACEIVLRSQRRMTPSKLVELTKPFRSADFLKPQSEMREVETLKLSDGTLVWANKHEGHTVIVIKGPCYIRNEDVFDREAAKVRPPTSNH